MNLLCSIVLALIFVSVGANSYLVGNKECTWGPSFWCKNITNAKSCGAVTHCIQTSWIHKKVPVDDDEVCKICLEMVKEARDQLESNQTQEELKEVFEGSCNLIPIKAVAKECCKLADDFVPELVETLSSQMNPQVVCTVAGLCNNEWVDKQLQEMKAEKAVIPVTRMLDTTDLGLNDCQGCNVVVDILQNRLHTTSRDEVLNSILQACGRLGSLSDSCSAIVITYFNEIYKFLQQNLKSEGVCHIAGVCSDAFHIHRTQKKRVEVIHESNVGVVKPNSDLPCELCEQLVIHLHDILVANTTEQEFEEVLEGLCKQTGSFKDECLSLVKEYYAVIYNFLVNSLQAGEVCKVAGLCGNSGSIRKGPIWPLLPAHAVEKLEATNLEHSDAVVKATPLNPAQPVDRIPATPLRDAQPIENPKLHRVPIGDKGVTVIRQEVQLPVKPEVQQPVKPEEYQLPVSRMAPRTTVYFNNREVCEFCQLFLHFVQQKITVPKTVEQIEELVKDACDHFPAVVEGQCREFVDEYGKAFIVLLAQEIDPSLVCPKLGLCPSKNMKIMLDMMQSVNDKPTCPLCLLAVQSLVNKLKDNKTEEEIKQELENLCDGLPQSLARECKDFVNTYTNELVEMITADFTPEEICTYLKLCDPSKKKVTAPLPDILTNEIPDVPKTKVIKEKKPIKDDSLCVICEFVMSKIDEELKDNSTEEEIKQVVKNICNHLPQSVSKECDQFVDEYADLVIAFLTQSLTPQEVCGAIKLCKSTQFRHPVLAASLKKSVRQCAVCEAAMGALDELMSDPNVQMDIDQFLKQICPMLPAQDQDECRALIDIYGPSILNVVSTVADPRLVCMELGICNWQRQTVNMLGGKKCKWGPGYWCQSFAHARGCDTVEYCQIKIWKEKKPAN